MRRLQFGLLFPLLVLGGSVSAQQAGGPQRVTAPQPIHDPQAVNVVGQALNVAGGASAISSIKDYTASGNVTYHWGQGVNGTVTLTGRGLYQLRMDANLPAGIRSQTISDGRTGIKKEDGTLSWFPKEAVVPGQRPKPTPSSDALPYHAPMFPGGLALPYQELAAVLNNPQFKISHKGIVQVDGRSVYDIQVQRVVPKLAGPVSEFRIKDFFIDVSTSQVVMTRDLVPKHTVHEIRYSDYRPANGVLFPFSISEEIAGQKTWEIQLNNATFNTGLQDSAFVLE
jgi:hypothetical protein